MNTAHEVAGNQDPFPTGATRAQAAVLAARRALHCRLGLPFMALGAICLLMALLKYLEWGPVPSLAVLVSTAGLAGIALAFRARRMRIQGGWARPAGDPGLVPANQSAPDISTTEWIQRVGLLLAAAIGVAAYFAGVTFESLVHWIIAYGLIHMSLYALSLCLNLRMREQALPALWFTAGLAYWLSTGQTVAIIFGGGWLLMGLLLELRLRRSGKSAQQDSPAADSEDAP